MAIAFGLAPALFAALVTDALTSLLEIDNSSRMVSARLRVVLTSVLTRSPRAGTTPL